jgi:hypothetical protein
MKPALAWLWLLNKFLDVGVVRPWFVSALPFPLFFLLRTFHHGISFVSFYFRLWGLSSPERARHEAVGPSGLLIPAVQLISTRECSMLA